jgi:putative DNA primase/helicase
VSAADATRSGALLHEIDALKASTDLPSIIAGSLTLRRRGRLHIAPCPFHAERTPSFNVWPDHFHCYGCGAHGDVFDWLRHQHGMTLPDAVRHLGGGNGALALNADHAAVRANRKAGADAKIEAARREAIGEAVRWWRNTVPIAGTIAERYLIETRGIPRPADGWPDCVRFLRGNGKLRLTTEGLGGEEITPTAATAGALIVAATISGGGELCAVQRIYVDADAQNIRRQDAKGSRVKLTAGTFAATRRGLDAGVVRLPGAATGPLLIAEGAETALSVETWVTLGNIANATPPRDRRVCICRDDDKPHSTADKQLTAALGRWSEAGHSLVVATPWPERRGDRSDFNDTLQAAGVAAVRARISAALEPGPSPPKRLPVEEGRRLVSDAVRKFFTSAAAYDALRTGEPANGPAALPPSEEPPPASEDDDAAGIDAADVPSEDPTALPVHLVQIDMGGGKSRRARIEVAQVLADMRGRGDTRNIAIAVPTHTLGTEQARLFEELPAVRSAGLRVAIWRGRERDNPDAPGETMCRNLELVRDVQALKLDVRKKACPVCPHREDCAYLSQNAQRADLWLVAHQMLFERKPTALGKLAAVVVDESPLITSLEGVERHISLPLDVLERVDLIEDASLATDRLVFLRRLAKGALDSLPDGPLSREALLAAGFTAATAKEARGLEWRTQIDVELKADMTPSERRDALDAARLNADLGRRVWWWRALGALLELGGAELSGWAALGTEDGAGDPDGLPARYITLKGRRPVSVRWQVPTLLLDATARPELLRYVWPGLQLTADLRLQAPYQRVRQVADSANALSRLDVDGASDDAERLHRQRNLARVHAVICREGRQRPQGRVLVVVQKRIEDLLLDLGNLPGNVELAHHNGVRGRDGWGDVAALVVIGRTMPRSGAIARMTEALTAQAMPSRQYRTATAWRELADGTAQACEALAYPDPIGEALRWQICEAEVVQIIGRGRGVNRGASNPLDVLVLTDVPLPLPVELVTTASLEPSATDRMLAAGGVVVANCTDAAAAYPELWPSREAVKKMRQRESGQMGTFPYKYSTLIRECPHLELVEYQKAGPRFSQAVAWFDPAIVAPGLILRWLTERVGHLAWSRIGCLAENSEERRGPAGDL